MVTMSVKSRLSLLCLATLLVSTPARAGDFYIGADGSIGSANQTIDNSLMSFEYEAISAARASVSCGHFFSRHISGAFEAAWSQRGGGYTRTTVYRPDGDGFVRIDRTYLDISTPWSYRDHSGHFFMGAGASPRMSFLLKKPNPGCSPLASNAPILGTDPFAFVGYGAVHLSARYVFDFEPSYE